MDTCAFTLSLLISPPVISAGFLVGGNNPPDKQEKATQTVLEQAELLSAEWAMA